MGADRATRAAPRAVPSRPFGEYHGAEEQELRSTLIVGLIEATNLYGFDLEGNDFAATANIIIRRLKEQVR